MKRFAGENASGEALDNLWNDQGVAGYPHDLPSKI